MLNALKKLFGFKTPEPTQPEAAPYKVETPVAPTPASEKAVEAVVKSVAKPAPAKKAGAKKTGGNKPRSPRKPKATK